MPNEAGFFCLDIDNKNGKNGIENLKKISKEYNLDLKKFFNNTVYVKTPNNGYHFYFKFQNNYKGNLKSQICPGVEVKYKKDLTAAGSVKDGKIYLLNGMLENALPLPEKILEMAKREPAKPKEKHSYYKPNYEGKKPSLALLMEETIRDRTGHNDRAYKFASKCNRCNYTLEEAKEVISANPDIFGTDSDLIGTIKSAYHIKEDI